MELQNKTTELSAQWGLVVWYWCLQLVQALAVKEGNLVTCSRACKKFIMKSSLVLTHEPQYPNCSIWSIPKHLGKMKLGLGARNPKVKDP